MRRVIWLLILFFLSLAFPATENLALWSDSLSIHLSTGPDGADVTGMVTDFPILIRLKGSEFDFSGSKGNGRDLRFSKPDGTPLPYQIERWDSAHAKAEIWVRMDTVLGNSEAQSLVMHWGNGGAADASDGAAVFDTGNGFVAGWHLGWAGSAGRPNSVKGGAPAFSRYADGRESCEGMVGLADSLDGDADGNYFEIGDGYSEFANGFTYSVWSYPTAAGSWSRLLELGNGPGLDNVVLQRFSGTEEMSFLNYQGNQGGKTLHATHAIPLNQWQFFTVTVSGSSAKIYRNGILLASDTLGNTISSVRRAYNYLGKSDWSTGAYYQGILDEPILSKVSRSADWIKLSYANQNANQTLVSFRKPVSCRADFRVPTDTSLAEGSTVMLFGLADCADHFFWTTTAQNGPRILDPEVKSLRLLLPRVSQTTQFKYLFNARYGDSLKTGEVKITVLEAIPDPVFTLPPTLDWNGRDSLLVKPSITNLAALKASPAATLEYAWTLDPADADTSWREGAMLLRTMPESGDFTLGLCLSNHGTAVCQSTVVQVSLALAVPVSPRPETTPRVPARADKRFDAQGRWGLTPIGFLP